MATKADIGVSPSFVPNTHAYVIKECILCMYDGTYVLYVGEVYGILRNQFLAQINSNSDMAYTEGL